MEAHSSIEVFLGALSALDLKSSNNSVSSAVYLQEWPASIQLPGLS